MIGEKIALSHRELLLVRRPHWPCFGNYEYRMLHPKTITYKEYKAGDYLDEKPPCIQRCSQFDRKTCRKITLFQIRHRGYIGRSVFIIPPCLKFPAVKP